ncbi:MAG: TetR/AcrR family transcriptional regulator [Enterocloster citroniae]|nr:TetR/AcrR family transcriptional regulator [Enterocloster citroniae]
MPTERFDKLPEQKKIRISDAISEEFGRGQTGEIHITQIARSARVSRGSLYSYFRSKEDMLSFSLHQTQRFIWDTNKEILREKDGDYWEMLETSLRYQFSICRTNRLYRLLYLPLEGNESFSSLSYSLFWGKEYADYKTWIYGHMHPAYRERFSEEEFGVYQDTCNDILTVAIQIYMTDAGKKEEITGMFHKKMTHMKPVVDRMAV